MIYILCKLGLKFIPPGIHFVYYSPPNSNFRSGFFTDCKAGKVLVFNWDAQEEVFVEESNLDQIERISCHLPDFDPGLGYYPQGPTPATNNVDTRSKWLEMTKYASFNLILSLLEKCDLKISAMSSISKYSDVLQKHRTADLDKVTTMVEQQKQRQQNSLSSSLTNATQPNLPKEESAAGETDQKDTISHDNNTNTGKDWIDFVPINLKSSFPPNATPLDRTRYSLDKSYLLQTLLTLEKRFKKDSDILGEFQLCFLMFLLGQVYDGFEQWKTILSLFCHVGAGEGIGKRPLLFTQFLECLMMQLKVFPSDFFQDELSQSPFLEDCFVCLVENCGEAVEIAVNKVGAGGGVLDFHHEGLRVKLAEFEHLVREKFDWDLGAEGRAGLEEYGEEAPIVVEM